MKTINSIKSKSSKSAAPKSKRATTPKPAPEIEVTTEQIAQRAHLIWEQQGRPSGRALENWLEAEKQLKSLAQ